MRQKIKAAKAVPTREKILAAARALFAARGFKGTTTAAIARHARVNEALIFRYFPAKQALYDAILRAKLEDVRLARLIDPADYRSLPVEEALRLVAQRFSESADPEFMRLYYHSALEGHELANGFYDRFVRHLMALVEGLIRRGAREGRFRKGDARVGALAFTGMLRSYCLTTELFPDHALKTDRRAVARTFCDLFLRGMAR